MLVLLPLHHKSQLLSIRLNGFLGDKKMQPYFLAKKIIFLYISDAYKEDEVSK